MSRRFDIQYADPLGEIVRLPGVGIVLAQTDGTPAATSGYAPGCVAVDRTNGIIYRNSGNATTASWQAVSSSGSGAFTNASVSAFLTMGNGAAIVANTGNGGLKIGTATNQKFGLWNVTPVVQPAGTGELIGIIGNSATNVNATNMNSNGNSGTAAYSFNDVVKALKQVGILAA